MKKYYKSKGIDPFTVLPLTYTVTGASGMGIESNTSFIKLKMKIREETINNREKSIWICKPGENSNRGRGIIVCKDLKQIQAFIEQSPD